MGLWDRIKRLLRRPGEEINGVVLLLTSPRTLEPERIERLLAEIGAPATCVQANEMWLAIPDLKIAILHAPHPYVPPGESMDRFVSLIRELRLRDAFSSHLAFVSLHVAPNTEPAAAERARGLLCQLAARLVDDTTALIWDTRSNRMVLPTDDVLEALAKGEDSAFRVISWDAISEANYLDKRVQDAVQEAKTRFPEFEAAFVEGGLDLAIAKAPFADRNGDNEHMWFEVSALEGGRIRGKLVNQPRNVYGLSEGSEVDVSVEDLSDWLFVKGQDHTGGFLEQVLRGG